MKKTYTLGKIKQLIDLNGDSKNFDLTFKVTCNDDTPYHVLVVDQTTLDNNPNLEYKKTIGSISGNILADKNIYQNYFLILKSDKVCDVEVEVEKNDLPLTPNIPDAQQPTQRPNQRSNQQKNTKSSVEPLWKKMMFPVIIIGVLALLYYLYKRKKNDKDNKDNKGKDGDKKMAQSPNKPMHSNRSSSPSSRRSMSPVHSPAPRPRNLSLSDRLKSLKINA